MVELTDRERKTVERIQRGAKLWKRYRWCGLAGALVLTACGCFLIIDALGMAIHTKSVPPLVGLVVAPASWLLAVMGVVLFADVIYRWGGSTKDEILVKLVAHSGALENDRDEGTSS